MWQGWGVQSRQFLGVLSVEGAGCNGFIRNVSKSYLQDRSTKFDGATLDEDGILHGLPFDASTIGAFQVTQSIGSIFKANRRVTTRDGWIIEDEIRGLASSHNQFSHAQRVPSARFRSKDQLEVDCRGQWRRSLNVHIFGVHFF